MKKEQQCENCSMRAKYDINPKSLTGRFWRWHINFCPGWNRYMKSLDEDSRRSLCEKYKLKQKKYLQSNYESKTNISTQRK